MQQSLPFQTIWVLGGAPREAFYLSALCWSDEPHSDSWLFTSRICLAGPSCSHQYIIKGGGEERHRPCYSTTGLVAGEHTGVFFSALFFQRGWLPDSRGSFTQFIHKYINSLVKSPSSLASSLPFHNASILKVAHFFKKISLSKVL